MRARFNYALDGNIGSLIFKHLTRLDLCLSRAVCKDWWSLIPKQKLNLKEDFFGTLVEYDRLEYVSSVKKQTLFLIPKKYEIKDFIYTLIEKKAVYTTILFLDFCKHKYYISILSDCCNPCEDHWNNVFFTNN